MSIVVGPAQIFSPPPQPQNNQPASDQPQPSQTQAQSQSNPTPAKENQPISATSASKNDGDSAQARTPDQQLAARADPPIQASKQSIIDAQTAAPAPQADASDARRDAESAREAYIAQAIIDRVQSGPDSAIAGLFATPDVEKPADTTQSAALADAGEPQAAVAQDPFAKAD